MESKKLSFNLRYIWRDFLRHWPIWVSVTCIYLITVTGVVGLYNYLDRSVDYVTADVARELLYISGLMSFILGIIAADSAFGYLGSKKKQYFFDALPMNRLSMFSNRFVFGYMLMFVPNLILFFIEMIQIAVITGELVLAPLACWLLIIAAQNLFWLTFGTLFMVLCGRKLMAGFCYFAFSFFGVVIEYTLAIFNSFMFLGYWSTVSDSDFLNIGIFSPFEYMYRYMRPAGGNVYYSYGVVLEGQTGIEGYFGVTRLLVVFLAFAVLLILSYILYSKRKAEKTGDNIVFRFMKTVFSWCFTTFFAAELTFLMIGLFVYNVDALTRDGLSHDPGGRVAFVIMIIIFGIAGYMISCMIIEKKFRIFKKYLIQSLVCTGVLVVFFIVYMHDAFGIEKYIPDMEDISFARVTCGQFYNTKTYYGSDDPEMTEDEKQVVVDLQKLIFDNLEDVAENNKAVSYAGYYVSSVGSYEAAYEDQFDSEYYINSNTLRINFYLKDGREIFRSYYIKPEGKPYEEIKAYVKDHSDYFAKGDAEINYYY